MDTTGRPTKKRPMAPWTINERHCMHILATHYPYSSWVDRAAIFNEVFTETLTATQIRDEYGGHKAGQRNRPGNLKPTRSVQWHDHVCRDEFNLSGPFDLVQQTDRGILLQEIQNAIVTLGLTRNKGLRAVALVNGMDMADTSLAPVGAAAAAPPPVIAPVPALAAATVVVAPPVPAPVAAPTGSTSSAQTFQFGTSTAATVSTFQFGASTTNNHNLDAGEEDAESSVEPVEQTEQHADDASDTSSAPSCDPEEGGANYYHIREIQREGRDFVFRGIVGLHYDDEIPATTWQRWVRFPAMEMRGFNIRVCDVVTCEVRGDLRMSDVE